MIWFYIGLGIGCSIWIGSFFWWFFKINCEINDEYNDDEGTTGYIAYANTDPTTDPTIDHSNIEILNKLTAIEKQLEELNKKKD